VYWVTESADAEGTSEPRTSKEPASNLKHVDNRKILPVNTVPRIPGIKVKSGTVMTIEDCRRFYAEEVRIAAGLSGGPLIEAFARVPRDQFIGSPPWQIASPDMMSGGTSYISTENLQDLYHNVLIALDPKRHLNNGQPSALAHWIHALDLEAGSRIFHLGCGVGYYTAIMAEVVGASGNVVAAEIDPGLAARAQQNLAKYPYVTVHVADGAAFDPGECDAMLINAGVTHPQTLWLNRLLPGGRLVLPLTAGSGVIPGAGVMVKVEANAGNFWSAQVVSFVAIFPCTSARHPELEPILEQALKSRALLNVKSLRRDRHEQTETCIVHGPETCFSSTASVNS
jgi:protein-L-isoaspartate(D-aspartate) O-methyltransferase